MTRQWMGWAAVAGLAIITGCGGDAGLQLAASDALAAAADQIENGFAEYHDEVTEYDDSRENAVTAAFVSRVVANKDNPAALEKDTAEFTAALRNIRADRETEWKRWTASAENVAVLREMGVKLEKLALDSLSLRDESLRYITGWIQNGRKYREEKQTQAAAARAEKKARRQTRSAGETSPK